MRTAQVSLLQLVDRIFEDGIVTDEERAELRGLYRDGALTVREVRDVFNAFLKKTWAEISADGVVTIEERAMLETIAVELKLPFT
jgi:hypothetical protein